MTHFADRDVEIRQEVRKSLALRIMPDGLVAFMPRELDPNSNDVRQVFEQDLQRLSKPQAWPAEPLTPAQIFDLVQDRADHLDVDAGRVLVREM